VLFYQPIVDVQTGTAGKVEALVRWQHPQRGLLSPGHFISLAEDTGLIEPLTIWVFRTALRQCATWHREGLDVRVAVNLSARSLHDSTLPDTAASVLHGAGIPPTAIEVEITEGTLMADPEQAMKLLARLHELGVRVSVDDFGTGYSSLAYLKTLPIDEVKIDRGFVTDMERSDNDAIIVRSVIDLGHNLGLSVTAEGVETRAAWEMLQARRCDLAQGFFLSRPLPGPDATSWLREPAHRTVEGRAACN
jgi:EAL domain-containing protein (putative c-di-GMP-specific phosphodiesterase class I)